MKIALCLSGQLRNYDFCYSFLKEHLLDLCLDYDIFIHNWDTKNHKIGWLRQPDAKERFKNDNLENAIELYKPKKYLREDWEEYHKKFKKLLINEFNSKHIDGMLGDNQLGMFYSIYKCNCIRKEYEIENNIKYDIIIRIRPDFVLVRDAFTIESLEDVIKYNKLVIPMCANGIGYKEKKTRYSDLISYGTSEVMDYYCDIFNNLKKYINDEKVPFESESLLTYHLINSSINIETYNFIGHISHYYTPSNHKAIVKEYKLENFKNKSFVISDFNKIIEKRSKNTNIHKTKYINNIYNYKGKLLRDNSKIIFNSYYESAIKNYLKNDIENVYNFGFKVIDTENEFNNFFTNVDYNKYLSYVNEISELFNSRNIEPNGICDEKVICMRVTIDAIHSNKDHFINLYKLLFPYIEKNIYNSNIKLLDINAYKTCVSGLDKDVSSWIWHFDNHPNEFIKMMIYLTDVDEKSAPLQIMVDSNNNPVKMVSNRVSKEGWKEKEPYKYFHNQFNGNRLHENDINKMIENGYNIKEIYGKKGTIILFSENIIHKATYPESKERLVVNTVISPSINKKDIIISKDLLSDSDKYKKWDDN